jgi:hypothetical protein
MSKVQLTCLRRVNVVQLSAEYSIAVRPILSRRVPSVVVCLAQLALLIDLDELVATIFSNS